MTKLEKIDEILDFCGIKLYAYQKVLISLHFTRKEIDDQYKMMLKIMSSIR